jgi:inward rectifier potassium channel
MATLNAVFHRLSQPSEPIRWSQVALITSDKFTEHSFKKLHPDEKPPKSFLLRLNLTNPTDMVLIDCKFQLVYRRFLTSPGQLSPYITTVPLKLMHAEVAYLRYALVVRHVIDDESPLYGLDIEVGHVVNLPRQLFLHVSSLFSLCFSLLVLTLS